VARVSNGAWSVTVADEGRGMSQEDQDRLFTPFAHAVPGSTGLGLAIVYRIVEEHGGALRVKSAPGEGTAITLTLPLWGRDQGGDDPGATGPAASSGPEAQS
jgi:two-component system sensor histidine kinase PilS (NtrC family)